MAKGFNGRGMRGMGGMGGSMNMNMVRQAQKMQADMQKMQAELEEKTYTATEFFSPDSGISWSFTPGNTSLTVKDGLAVSMIRVYTP